jgi:hypothetical protein
LGAACLVVLLYSFSNTTKASNRQSDENKKENNVDAD